MSTINENRNFAVIPTEFQDVKDGAITELGQSQAKAGEKGAMRLRLKTDKGDISVAYKEIDPNKKSSKSRSLFYKKIEVQDHLGNVRIVKVNISSLSKKLDVSRSTVAKSDAKTTATFVKHQAFTSELTKQGLKTRQAIMLATHIETKFDSWVHGKEEKYVKKDDSKLARTIQYIPSGNTGEVYVHLKSKGKGFIGSGGFGKVTKSITYSTGELIVQKNSLKNPDETAQDRCYNKTILTNEGIVQKEFTGCENVLQVIHIGDHGLLFEYMNMGDLKSVGNLSPEEDRSVIRQLCHGLGEIHAKGYVHRDVKEENFLVKREGDKIIVKIADLGLIGKAGTPDKLAGTSTYYSPDRIKGLFKFTPHQQDPKDDMFALGLTLYERKYGTLPSFCTLIRDLISMEANYHRLDEELQTLRKGFSSRERNALSAIMEDAIDPENIDFTKLGEKTTPEFREKAKEYVQLKKATKEKLGQLENELAVFHSTEPEKGTVDHLIWNLLNPHSSERPTAKEAEKEANMLNLEAIARKSKD